MNRLRSKLTYANVVATLALCLALAGGTAFAATQVLPKNSVGTKQLKNGAVTPTKLSAAARTVFGGPGAAGLPGPKGDPGAPGKEGAAGKEGSAAASPLSTVTVSRGPSETELFARATFDAPVQSEALIRGEVTPIISCDPPSIAEACFYIAELLVDGNPVAPAYTFGVNTTGGAAQPQLETFVATVPVGPGSHVVEMIYSLEDLGPNNVLIDHPSITVLTIPS